MGSRFIILALVILLVLGVACVSLPAVSAKVAGIVVVVDLSHGQGTLGLDILMKSVPEAEWYILVRSPEAAATLDPAICHLARGILVGTFDSMKLYPSCETAAAGVGGVEVSLSTLYADMVIIGQHDKALSDEEIDAILKWISKRPGVAVWIASDSDYGRGKIIQGVTNSELEALGVLLRLELVSVEDPVNNCGGRPYRVVSFVDPPDDLWFLKFGASRVLTHGPGVVAGFDPATGKFVPIKEREMTIGKSRIVTLLRTSENGIIRENTVDERPLEIKVYKAGETGRFPTAAAEIKPDGTIFIVSGETPYGGYQPMVTFRYYDKKLDGPRFVRNVILWATGYMGELKYIVELNKRIESMIKKGLEPIATDVKKSITEVKSSIDTVKASLGDLEKKLSSKIDTVSSEVSKLKSRVEDVAKEVGKISALESSIKDLSGKFSALESRVKSAESSIASLSGYQTAALALSIVALIIAIVAVALVFMRRK